MSKKLSVTIENSFANNAVAAFDAIGQSIGGVINGTKTFGQALSDLGSTAIQFFANFLMDIAKAIIQMYALAAAKQIVAAMGGTGALFHEGGVVGQVGGMSRGGQQASWWSGAPKYHSGAMGIGLAPNEQRAILKRGEEVLSTEDPRNIVNAGRGKGNRSDNSGGGGVRQVLVLDQAQIPAAMQSAHGERVVLTHIKANAGAIRSMLKV